MDIGRALITKIVDEGRVKEVDREGIKTNFLDDESGAVLNYIFRHQAEYKKVPTRDAVKIAFPNYEFSAPDEPLEYYIAQVKDSFRQNIFDAGIHEIAGIYQSDTKKAESMLRDMLSELSITAQSFKDVDFAANAADRVSYYDQRKTNPGADGILSGWSKLDYQTLGAHGEEFIVFVGEKYMGKSWNILWLALQAALQKKRVTIATKEMSQEAVVRRMDAIYAQVPFDSLRRGELTHAEEKRYKKRMEELAAADISVSVVREGVHTVEDIERKAVEKDADIIFADSVYLFDPDRSSRFSGETAKRMAISQKCKSIAQRLNVPFVVSVQAGRKKSKERVIDLDAIEWSNAFSQDADTVIFLHKDELDKELGRAQIHLLKSRDGDVTQFFINQDFQQMVFTERSEEMSPSTDVFEDDEGVLELD